MSQPIQSSATPLESFHKELASTKRPVFVLFSASFCAPCKPMKALMEQESKINKKVMLIVCDVAEAPDIAAHYGIRKIPITKIFVDGKVVDEINGPDTSKFKKLIEHYSR